MTIEVYEMWMRGEFAFEFDICVHEHGIAAVEMETNLLSFTHPKINPRLFAYPE